MADYRIEKDSMGEVKVPSGALYGAQTQRAVENFQTEAPAMPRPFIRALGLIKAAVAEANAELDLIEQDMAEAIMKASYEVSDGKYDDHFPVIVYQTGSGTSSNMNANEVIASLASKALGRPVHPNDHVNMGQSSNDVIPSAIHLGAALEVNERLLQGLAHLEGALIKRVVELKDIIKTGRTHLMDAMPVSLGQEVGAWVTQVQQSSTRLLDVMPRLCELALGGTAVGTGVNADRQMPGLAITRLQEATGLPLCEADDHFAAQGSMDTAVELSGQLRTLATALMKIANDMRWLNSGPIAGIGEISLPSLQPGSSIMPGKVNPVICESVMMASARVMGNDLTVGVCNSHGNFQLNVMLPLMAHCLMESIALMADSARMLADKAVAGFTVNEESIAESLGRNPVLVTALNPVIGYDKAAEIAKRAYAEGRPVIDVAKEMTDIPEEELVKLLDPRRLA
jgi:fumarate hydratase class II